jgi:hypothetical protein
MDRRVILLCAIPMGLAAGYAWSAMTAAAPRAYVPPKGTIVDVPPSPEDYPAVLDEDWSARSDDQAPPSPDATARAPTGQAVEPRVQYAGCNEVRAARKAPLQSGDPGYRIEMDGDGDGIACEPHRNG